MRFRRHFLTQAELHSESSAVCGKVRTLAQKLPSTESKFGISYFVHPSRPWSDLWMDDGSYDGESNCGASSVQATFPQGQKSVEEECRRLGSPDRTGRSKGGRDQRVLSIPDITLIIDADCPLSGIIKEKPSDSLFALDIVGSEAIQKSYNKLHKPLKADEILAQRSAIKEVATHKRPHGITDGVIEPTSKKRKTNGVSPQEYERLRQVAYHGQPMKDVLKTEDAPSHDPWAIDVTEDAVDPRFDYLEKERPIMAPKTLKEAPISLVRGGKSVPAVTKPKAGSSYNPLFEDWSNLLEAEGEKAIAAERKRLAEVKVELDKLERIKAAEDEMERAAGWQTEDESAWEGFESDYKGEGLKKKRPERKTPQERKRAERHKEKERKERAEKKAKEKDRREKRILEIKKQVDKEERERSELKLKATEEDNADEDVDDSIPRRRKLGKDALQVAPMELVLPDELQDSLRLLKPEGNLLKERFRSIMVRGKVETRRPIQQAKKKRRTLTEKWTYKDFQVGA